MTVRTCEPDGLRVLLFFEFDHRAPHDDITAFKQHLISCEEVLHSVELSGVYNFIVEASLEDLAAYNDWLDGLAEPIAQLATRYEACFICKRFIRQRNPSQALWVPTNDGMQRIDCGDITKVLAEGDYKRLYCGEKSWLHHITMADLMSQLPDDFLHLHRSAIVHVNFIDRVIHRGAAWVARLLDGTTLRIARSHVQPVMKRLRDASAKPDGVSPKLKQQGNETRQLIE